MPYPDVDELVVGWLRDVEGIVATTFTTEDDLSRSFPNLAYALPLVQVVRFGGGDDVPSLDEPMIDIDVYAMTREQSYTLAEQIRAAMRLRLAGYHTAGATVSKVRTIQGPSKRFYDNNAIRRFQAAYALTIHAPL